MATLAAQPLVNENGAAGLAIFALTLSFNLAGDGLRDLLDPKDY